MYFTCCCDCTTNNKTRRRNRQKRNRLDNGCENCADNCDCYEVDDVGNDNCGGDIAWSDGGSCGGGD